MMFDVYMMIFKWLYYGLSSEAHDYVLILNSHDMKANFYASR